MMNRSFSVVLDALHLDPANARTIIEDDLADLTASMAALGQLQPIVIRPHNGDGASVQTPQYAVVAGNRRVAAARSLGWNEIEAVELENGNATAVSAAENMVRRAMHPVDQWRAVASLVDNGMSFDDAADALGIEQRHARCLSWLGHMAPEVIEALGMQQQLPSQNTLRAIALVPHDRQVEAIKRATRKGFTDWQQAYSLCVRQRISRRVAIFDHGLMAWDEDLFAEPGSDEQFSTDNIVEFLEFQKKAFDAQVKAAKGRLIPTSLDRLGNPIAPNGWRLSWDAVPKRWKKDDPRKFAGAVATDGYRTGEVITRLVVPVERREQAESLGMDTPKVERPRDPITKAVQGRLAALKGEAVANALDNIVRETNLLGAVRLLLLTLAANNVRIEGQSSDLLSIAAELVDDDGGIKPVEPRGMCALAARAIMGIIHFSHPNTNFGTSGDAAEWIGSFLIASARMPRCDTEEILKGCSGDLLVEIARKYGVDDTGKVSELRKRLVGALPNWSPVDFGAPGPKPGWEVHEADNDEGEEPPPMAA